MSTLYNHIAQNSFKLKLKDLVQTVLFESTFSYNIHALIESIPETFIELSTYNTIQSFI